MRWVMIFDVPCIRNMSLKFMHTNCDWDNPSTRQSCPDINDEPVPEIDAASSCGWIPQHPDQLSLNRIDSTEG